MTNIKLLLPFAFNGLDLMTWYIQKDMGVIQYHRDITVDSASVLG